MNKLPTSTDNNELSGGIKLFGYLDKIRSFLFYNRFIGFTEFSLKRYITRVSSIVDKDSTILDAGAGQCQYRKYFKHTKYTSQDLCVGDSSWDFSHIDIKSEIYDIPVKDECFDNVLCIEVMEHLKYPHLAIKEFSRILKKNGRLFIVCPLTWGEHQKPHDYFRYTQFALKTLAEENGFRVQEIKKQGGKFIVLSQIITEMIPSFFIDRKQIFLGYFCKALFYPINISIAILLYLLDRTDIEKDLASQYECIFCKL